MVEGKSTARTIVASRRTAVASPTPACFSSSDDNAPKPDRWHLTLRPVTHDADSTDHVDTWYSVLTDGLTSAEKRAFAFGLKKSPSNNNGG